MIHNTGKLSLEFLEISQYYVYSDVRNEFNRALNQRIFSVKEGSNDKFPYFDHDSYTTISSEIFLQKFPKKIYLRSR